MTEFNILLDTSSWLAYFDASDNKQIKNILDGKSKIYASVISLFEIKKKFLRERIDEIRISKFIDFIKNRAIILDVYDKICSLAADYSFRHKLHSIDSIIYASASLKSCRLLTFDNDFRELENVDVLEGEK